MSTELKLNIDNRYSIIALLFFIPYIIVSRGVCRAMLEQ